MMMRHLSLFTAIVLPALALALTGCATNDMEISAATVAGGSLSGLKTYSWSADAGSSIRDPKIQNPGALDDKVRATVNAKLASKGYTPAPRGSGDFVIDYEVSVQDTFRESVVSQDFYVDNPVGGGGPAVVSGSGPGVVGVGGGGEGYYVDAPYSGPTTNVVTRGSIMVEVKDPATRKLIWRGNARTTIDPDAPEAVRRAAVQQAISGIMSKFPAAE